MGLVGLAILGVILGAAGMEFLRANKPEQVEKVENGVKRLLSFIRLPRADSNKTKEQ
jgi:hypothetical protein